MGGFTLEGTDQGHLYGGLNVGYSRGARIHNLTIKAVPGDAPGPPGETFVLALWHTEAASLEQVTLDGRIGGRPGSATMLGYNFTTGRTVADNVVAQYGAYGFGVALWRCAGAQVFNGCDFRFNRKAINIEQAIGGSYEFNGCDFRGLTGAAWHAQISAIDTSAVVTFRDPVVDTYPLRVRTYGTVALSGKNVQKDTDIRMWIDGRDVTNDPSKFLIVHSG